MNRLTGLPSIIGAGSGSFFDMCILPSHSMNGSSLIGMFSLLKSIASHGFGLAPALENPPLDWGDDRDC